MAAIIASIDDIVAVDIVAVDIVAVDIVAGAAAVSILVFLTESDLNLLPCLLLCLRAEECRWGEDLIECV